MAATYLLAMRCPVFRGRDPHLGFRTELENLCGDAKGKGTRAGNDLAEYPASDQAENNVPDRAEIEVRRCLARAHAGIRGQCGGPR